MQSNRIQGYVLLVVCRVVLLLWILGLLVFFASRFRGRVDMTSDGLYTLTDSTKKVLAGLDDRVLIEVYLTPDDKLPEAARDYRRMLRNALDEYVQLGKGKVEVEYLDPLADTTVREKAERLGIRAQTVQESGARAFSILEIWQGLRIRYGGDKQKVVPQIGFSAATAYYEQMLTPPIKELSLKQKPKIGVLAFPSEAGGGGFNPMNPMQRGGSQPQRFDRIREVAKGRYELTDLDLNEGKLVPDDIRTVLVIRPKNLNDRQKYALDQFLMRGGKLVVFADTVEFELGQQRTMQAQPVVYDTPDSRHKWTDVLAAYGVETDDKLVADVIRDTQETFAIMVQTMMGARPQPIPYPYWFHALDQDWAAPEVIDLFAADPLTGRIDEAKAKQYREAFKPGMDKSNPFIAALAKGLGRRGPGMFWPCRVELRQGGLPDGVTGNVLLRSSPAALVEAAPPSASPFSQYGNEVEKTRSLNEFLRRFNERIASEPRHQFGLMVHLKGGFPSYFAGKELPPRKPPEAKKEESKDPLAEPIKDKPLADSQPSTQSQPASQPEAQGPPAPGADVAKQDDKDKDPPFLAKAPATAELVVIGDADLMRDDLVSAEYAQAGGPYSVETAPRFFSGLLDWLSEDSDLMELTNKKTTERVLDYGKSLSLRPGDSVEEMTRSQERKATRLRLLTIAGPVGLVLAVWVIVFLRRRSQKEAFLASVGGR